MEPFEYLLLFAAHWVVAASITIWAEIDIGRARFGGFSPIYLIVPAAVALAFIKSRWVHGTALLALIGVYFAQFFGQQLGGG